MTDSGARVSGLYVYPVKSCAGEALEQAEIDLRGIVHDREFMLVDQAGVFVTQREAPRLALVRPRRRADHLELEAPGMPQLMVEPRDVGDSRPVTIWRDRVVAVDQGDQAAEWLSTFLQAAVRLVRMSTTTVRRVDPEFARRAADQVSFADGYPLLLISEESLADLNARLEAPLPMNRFRPNIVVRGIGSPYAEDDWAEICIGELACSRVKACARCVITTTDQATTMRGSEPLATLATYRRTPRGLVFGQNLIHARPGRIALGESVRVLPAGAQASMPGLCT